MLYLPSIVRVRQLFCLPSGTGVFSLKWPREYRFPKPWSRASSDACFMKPWRRASNDACFAELWRRASNDACFVKRWCRASSEACFTEAVLPSLRWSLLDEAGFISAKVGSGRTTGHTRFKALFFFGGQALFAHLTYSVHPSGPLYQPAGGRVTSHF